MNTAAEYTPLERLLLFQSLIAYGTEDKSFVRISDLLTNNTLIKDGDTYDAGRLGADALRGLYLQLLRDELKAEEDLQEDAGPGSKKRKFPSPALPTINDAEQHRDKLPILVDRLYARYRNHMVEAIREDERRYALLQQEVLEINRGEWDERILKENKAMANRNSSVSPQEHRSKFNGASSVAPSHEKVAEISSIPQLPIDEKAKAPSPVPSPQIESKSEGLAISDVLNSRESTRPSSPQGAEPKPRNGPQSVPPPNQHRPSSILGPHGPSPLQPVQQQPGIAYKWEPPYQAGPPHQPPPYQPGAPFPPFNPQQYPSQAYPLPARGSFPGPHVVQHPHVPSSPLNVQHPKPILIPPPNGTHGSPSSSAMPLDALADAAGQQYRATSGSPMIQGPPPPGGYAQTYPPQRIPSSGGPPQWNQQYVPPYHGPPQQYPFSPTLNQRPFPPRPDLVPPENRQYNSPYNASQSPRPPMPQNSIPRPRSSLPNTPISRASSRYMTGSGTRWTPTPTGSTPRPYTLAEPPVVEPMSPILHPAKLLSSKEPTKRKSLKAEAPKAKQPAPKRGSQRTRAGSTTSSVIAGSYRSQSVLSHADELSLDNNIKEEVATPLPLPLNLEDETGDTTADESLPNRRARPSYIATSPKRLKRKRNNSIPETTNQPTTLATHVLWTRAFPKISASALESISGHRNASMFAAPVKERDAPGYKHLILRPQDLKSIKSAILAGHRAATSAVPDDTLPVQSSVWLPISEDLVPPKGIINYAQLEKELMRMFANAIMFNADPDRGLGASWEEMREREQRGGEGYEIDEDGVVKDTTAMYADVEKIVGSLRSAERRSEEMIGGNGSGTRVGSVTRGSSVVGDGEDDVDELAGDGNVDSVSGTTVKRRRKV